MKVFLRCLRNFSLWRNFGRLIVTKIVILGKKRGRKNAVKSNVLLNLKQELRCAASRFGVMTCRWQIFLNFLNIRRHLLF